jgi:gliding motility-associated-like protein
MPVQFTDRSISNSPVKNITSWQWDFGDNTEISTLQNPPLHTYLEGGLYTVKLTVGLDGGCKSAVKTFDVTVQPKIHTLFNVQKDLCINTEFTLTDQTTISSGKIVKWTWDFGDGNGPQDLLPPFKYIYTKLGPHSITLITTSENGCVSLPDKQDVTVHSLPEADFLVPGVCLLDEYASFKNTSPGVDDPASHLTYIWNYGDTDPDLPASLNTSIGKNGKHPYKYTGEYPVKLTVINEFGCRTSVEKKLIVSGQDPKAYFKVEDEDKLCSSQSVRVKDLSTVIPGKISKLEWSVENHPEMTQVYENPIANGVYEFTFDSFNDQTSKNYTIHLKAYSGGVCYNEYERTVPLFAVPSVKFDALPSICLNANPIKLTQASETGSLPGKGIYTGDGISLSGIFNPATAGVGRHPITYTYTFSGINSCSEFKTVNIEVYPLPTVELEKEVYVFAGGQKRVAVIAKGSNVTYKWSPPVGLDRTDIFNPMITPAKDIRYTVAVRSDQGCEVLKSVYVYVLNSIEVANTFSPNGDGINDFWNIKYIDTYPNATVEIFDRYGAKVFFSRGYSVPFDGNFNSEPLPVGTYYYIIDPKNGKQKKSGSLTLIR